MIQVESLFKISYGLYIVSSGNEQVKNGFISNTVFQITSEPVFFAASCSKNNYTTELINNTGYFSVSVLSQQASNEIIGRFGYKSGKDINKFEGVKYKIGSTGVPVVLDDTIAYFEFKVVQTIYMGTHNVFICELIHAEVIDNNTEVLTYDYYRKVKKGVAPKNAPTYIDKSKFASNNNKTQSDYYKCPVCGYIYDPEKGDPNSGIKPGTSFEDIPDTWMCPVCGIAKSEFIKID